MTKAIRFVPTIPAPYIPSKSDSYRSDSYKSDSRPSDYHQFIPVALFSGIGLLVSLVAILCGVQGVWY